ncbi:hypothetical protein SAMN00120144_4203 [Hymenobacter roseosalivarius DSM 11622]|uniref:Uncharacterized protein n=1 Tax=Hymenobacter roseosalivarius DSM 11622 TaxID=645990 RepID=A0A1W1UII3_9BACT|nr:hypothetical protein [Hymenobacter roseosalivarius]SMB80839.1 hypothetical protein SAMN00120144_4203 [Hymenobacter roseosalivarius DSM 11622]
MKLHLPLLLSQWKDKPSKRTYPRDEFKQMLHLKNPKGKDPDPELFQNISQFKARVLDCCAPGQRAHRPQD